MTIDKLEIAEMILQLREFTRTNLVLDQVQPFCHEDWDEPILIKDNLSIEQKQALLQSGEFTPETLQEHDFALMALANELYQ